LQIIDRARCVQSCTPPKGKKGHHPATG
jgi:hypothetical protein